MQLAVHIIVLINLFEDAIRARPYTQCDETPLQVLKEVGRKASSQSYVWVRHGGLPGQEVVIDNDFPTRSSEAVLSLFEDYQGYVQCDSYSAVD
ncbi:MAG: transposase [Pseudomonadales bacterium]